MTDLAKLVVTLEAQNAKYLKSLAQSEKRMKRFEKSTKKSLDVVKGLFVSLGAVSIGKSIISTTREIDSLKATLETLEGSRAGANRAFSFISDFASTTPFQLQQVTQAFIKLKALGLDPSEDALRSYGNTASSMGKNLNQFVEAVADAITGEFERLKEFGIKSKTEGDRVKFTFQGITTEVAKTAEGIEGFLRDIGKNQFAGALERQANTLDGILSNIEDSFTRLAVADDGSLDGLKTSLKDINDLLNDPATVAGFSNLATAVVKLASETANAVSEFGNLFDQIAINTAALAGNLSDIDRLKQEIKDVDRALKGGLSTPIKFLFTNKEELLAEKEKLLADLKTIEINLTGSTTVKPDGAGQSAVTTKNTGVDKLDTGAKNAAGSLKVFQATLDKINGTDEKLTADNVKFSDLTRFTAEARIAQAGGDNEKALKLAEQGAKAVELLKQSGKESTLVLSGALKKLDAIAAKATAKEADKKEEAPVVGILEIKGLGKDISIQGDSNQIKDFVQQLTGALKAEAVAVSG
jgi:hypothetical protein